MNESNVYFSGLLGLIEGHFLCTLHFFASFLIIQRKKDMYFLYFYFLFREEGESNKKQNNILEIKIEIKI